MMPIYINKTLLIYKKERLITKVKFMQIKLTTFYCNRMIQPLVYIVDVFLYKQYKVQLET